MKNKINPIIVFIFSIILIACSSRNDVTIKVTNPTNLDLKDAVVRASLTGNQKYFNLISDDKEIPYQIINSGNDNQIEFVTDLSPNEVKVFHLKEIKADEMKSFAPRTHAELSAKTGDVYIDKRFRGDKFVKVTHLKVPPIHTDHDALFKFEGPGWESEKVGYRFYLDWRNATDIFGKKKNQLILDQVGTHDTVAKDDSYHSMQEWGMDIFKVGSSLGIGSIGMWANDKVNMVSKTDSVICSIPYTGPIEAKINTDYYGWQVGDKKYDLNSDFTITAGSRLTKSEIQISPNADNIVTGLAKHENTELIKSNYKEGWNYLALYGKQSLADNEDQLGIVVFYPADKLINLSEDALSHIVELKPLNGKVTYYFAAAWVQEENGIKNIVEFKKYLETTIQTLNNPVIVEIKEK
jgi:hypothetical protein